MSQNNSPENRPAPSWIVYLFAVILIVGAGYAVYATFPMFRGQTHKAMVLEALGTTTVQPKLEIVPARTPAALADGEKTFKTVCFACHGADLRGGVGPNLIDNEWLHPPAKETNLFKWVNNGISGADVKKGVPMPAKGGASISGEQVWNVIYFLSSKNPGIEKDAVPTVK